MTPEEFRNLSSEDQLLHLKGAAIHEIASWGIDFPGRPDSHYINKIAFQEGKSLGASVAEAIVAEKDELLDQLAGQAYDNIRGSFTNPTIEEAKGIGKALSRSLLLDLTYCEPMQDLLVAEEVVRNSEPPVEFDETSVDDSLGVEMENLVERIFIRLASHKAGRPLTKEEWEDQQAANEADIYLEKRRLGGLLRKSIDPLEFIDERAKKLLHSLPDLDKSIYQQFIAAVFNHLVETGRERFYTLYIAATQARSKCACLSLEERHQESLRLAVRKHLFPY
ncbi:hypothetical protein A3A14_01615 [Candidatus Daviesbacteria bacterium RIFCSPLOWO2_01_FULL_43_38]|uniref:Uncharacterized protein n=1 Tax=Candidatus Daviesbacteria bacterium RIFCSPHIGHO2_12_FULL_43_11 TaxID=1797780 RepID=A0A1F5K325_9BACT|nr:MAG: hypothetical protein A2874_03675 [Candidatus Daviesbacteria bacterium RIFCSPHIGHO2_01_FULL_43_17]OGE35269.1 MAG: hypothetical protein A3E45_03810 [Candidatus Daviesbacteria bacterium RIFCSPHIGHO2_12_FULL_43_11]OGE63389.1 MAG: hypothetical protein A3A14_01615 [Candidatus Daviesbacteria bacterium RIFCSPLOWO2_01_FULL_43_38]OGE69234.1 MAG: hypothetical protein A3J21_01775 [Candidatus Daviesbacteria bacterium RIFCSPLOWO2_02_FULL_43_11]